MPEQSSHETSTQPQRDVDQKHVVAALAKRFDCLTEEDLAALAGVKLTTLEAWRRRHKGPPYLLFGNRYLYPRRPASKFLSQLVRNPADEAA